MVELALTICVGLLVCVVLSAVALDILSWFE